MLPRTKATAAPLLCSSGVEYVADSPIRGSSDRFGFEPCNEERVVETHFPRRITTSYGVSRPSGKSRQLDR